jgi:hypothetical protein
MRVKERKVEQVVTFSDVKEPQSLWLWPRWISQGKREHHG